MIGYATVSRSAALFAGGTEEVDTTRSYLPLSASCTPNTMEGDGLKERESKEGCATW